jgi:superfamily II DNA helicase RecQ
MERWQRGDGRLIVATNVFGLGIDAPDVRVVIHAEEIYQMRSYSQASGPGGLDGKRRHFVWVSVLGCWGVYICNEKILCEFRRIVHVN